ncbi:hypothetical protein MNBD_NITROSPINAE04-816 [hydrothermal vent metagenome]|uniref:4Fe-4S ferredoxin-type domain-containing protein n=1 Tax=hydrothermal vent metagenome TaxID=652676 RepID=A0A3B1BF85_9ZZZZ
MPLLTFSEELAEWSNFNLINCIGVDECMKVCPVVDPGLPIKELNEATRKGGKLTESVLKFAQDCVQCGRCDAVCPTAAGRSVMMLSLKEKMNEEGKAPEYHKKYFALKGHDKSSLRQAGFKTYVKTKWKFSENDSLKSHKLSEHIDKSVFRKAEYLFYFGCYIYTGEKSAAQCIDIADKLGIDYEVLGGLKSCCGWPQLMGGRTGEAEDYHKRLAELVEKSDPKYVISGCAECYMSLRKIKEKYKMAFEPLTTPMWLNRFPDKLRLEKSETKVTFHDSCNVSRKARMPEPGRELLGRMNPIVEMGRSGADDTFCCGYWGLGSDPKQLKAIHKSRYEEAKKTGADMMVVECITCLESFGKDAKENGVEVRDIVDLVHERMRL